MIGVVRILGSIAIGSSKGGSLEKCGNNEEFFKFHYFLPINIDFNMRIKKNLKKYKINNFLLFYKFLPKSLH